MKPRIPSGANGGPITPSNQHADAGEPGAGPAAGCLPDVYRMKGAAAPPNDDLGGSVQSISPAQLSAGDTGDTGKVRRPISPAQREALNGGGNKIPAGVRASREQQKQAAAAAREMTLQKFVNDELSTYSPAAQGDPGLRRELRAAARNQMRIDEMHDAIDRGEKLGVRMLEGLARLSSTHHAHLTSCRSKGAWSSSDDEQHRRVIPASVADWIDSLDVEEETAAAARGVCYRCSGMLVEAPACGDKHGPKPV